MNHRIEVSPSGRATCKTCGKTIAKGELRLGEEYASSFGSEGVAIRWHHLMCGAGKLPNVLQCAMESYEGDIPGREALEAAMASSKKSEKPARKAGTGTLPLADLAPTGRAKCIHCGESIKNGSVRIAVEREVDTGTFVTKGAGYLHPDCCKAWAENGWEAGFDDLMAQVQANTAPDVPLPFGTAELEAEPKKKSTEKTGKEQEKSAGGDVPAFGHLTGKQVASTTAKLAKLKQMEAAIARGDAAEVRALLDAGVDVNADLDGSGHPPLWLAAHDGWFHVVQLLLDRGAKTDAVLVPDAGSAFDRACCYGSWSKRARAMSDEERESAFLAIVGAMLDKGAVADGGLLAAAAHASPGVVELLFSRGATDIGGALDESFGMRLEREVILLVSARATDRASLDKVLRAAARSLEDDEATATCAHLLDRGADPNAPDGEGWTALTWAVVHGTLDLVALLVRHGADGKIKIRQDLADASLRPGMTPRDIADSWGLADIAALLPVKIATKLSAKTLVGRWQLEEVEYLPVEEGADDGGFCDEGTGTLHDATEVGLGDAYLSFEKDGTFTGWAWTEESGKWRVKGSKVLLDIPSVQPTPEELTLREGMLARRETDEEHGREMELRYSRGSRRP